MLAAFSSTAPGRIGCCWSCRTASCRSNPTSPRFSESQGNRRSLQPCLATPGESRSFGMLPRPGIGSRRMLSQQCAPRQRTAGARLTPAPTLRRPSLASRRYSASPCRGRGTLPPSPPGRGSGSSEPARRGRPMTSLSISPSSPSAGISSAISLQSRILPS